MNTNPHARVILCYGDSNTWGQSDDKNIAGRYPANIRWTGQLQKALGDGYYIIEEGLGGRTTDLEHYNPTKPMRNGLTYFTPCFASQSPVDSIIIMLGTNDLKALYNRSVEEITQSLKQYVDVVRSGSPHTQIMLVSPIYIDATAPKFTAYYEGIYNEVSVQKSKKLAPVIKKLADQAECLFFDASTVAKAGRDGIHFDEQSHSNLAASFYRELSAS